VRATPHPDRADLRADGDGVPGRHPGARGRVAEDRVRRPSVVSGGTPDRGFGATPDGAGAGGRDPRARPRRHARYDGRPGDTAQVLRGGWLLTGDLGYLDADGYLYVVDRRTDLVVSGGENVYPAEVERVLQSHPAAEDACVVGAPDPMWGQVVVAAVLVRARPPAREHLDVLVEENALVLGKPFIPMVPEPENLVVLVPWGVVQEIGNIHGRFVHGHVGVRDHEYTHPAPEKRFCDSSKRVGLAGPGRSANEVVEHASPCTDGLRHRALQGRHRMQLRSGP